MKTLQQLAASALLIALTTTSFAAPVAHASAQAQIDDSLELIQEREAAAREALAAVTTFKEELKKTQEALSEAKRTYRGRQLAWGAATVGLLAGSAYLIHRARKLPSSVGSTNAGMFDLLALPFEMMEDLIKAAPYLAGASAGGVGAIVTGSVMYFNHKQLGELATKIETLTGELERSTAELNRQLNLLCKMKKALGKSC